MWTKPKGMPAGSDTTGKREGNAPATHPTPSCWSAETRSPTGQPNPTYAPLLYTHLHSQGQLIMRNQGRQEHDGRSGFRICAKCGRSLEPDETRHKYPSHVPPHRGQKRGATSRMAMPQTPKAKRNTSTWFTNSPHRPLPSPRTCPWTWDPAFIEPAGRAVWHSFGTLIKEAASRHLQIVPEEIQAGVRPIKDNHGRVQGEVFIYDDVPGGAGYARAISDNLKDIAEIALAIGRRCTKRCMSRRLLPLPAQLLQPTSPPLP